MSPLLNLLLRSFSHMTPRTSLKIQRSEFFILMITYPKRKSFSQKKMLFTGLQVYAHTEKYDAIIYSVLVHPASLGEFLFSFACPKRHPQQRKLSIVTFIRKGQSTCFILFKGKVLILNSPSNCGSFPFAHSFSTFHIGVQNEYK